jgi:hypothetical protein
MIFHEWAGFHCSGINGLDRLIYRPVPLLEHE